MFCLLQMTTDLGQDNDDMERKPIPPKRLQPLLWTDPVEITTKVTLGPLSKTGSKLCDLQLRRVYESQVSIKEVTEDWPSVPHHPNKGFLGFTSQGKFEVGDRWFLGWIAGDFQTEQNWSLSSARQEWCISLPPLLGGNKLMRELLQWKGKKRNEFFFFTALRAKKIKKNSEQAWTFLVYFTLTAPGSECL